MRQLVEHFQAIYRKQAHEKMTWCATWTVHINKSAITIEYTHSIVIKSLQYASNAAHPVKEMSEDAYRNQVGGTRTGNQGPGRTGRRLLLSSACASRLSLFTRDLSAEKHIVRSQFGDIEKVAAKR